MKISAGIIFLLFQACSSGTEKAAEPATPKTVDEVVFTESQSKSSGIVTGLAEKRNMQSLLKVNGTVEVPPQNIVSVSFPLGGYLKSTKLLPGMHVNRGEVIGIMEDPSLIQLQQDYLVAQTRLKYLELEYERQKTLRENQVNAEKTFQQVSAEFESQKIQVKSLAEKLRLIGIRPEQLSEENISRSVPLYSPINGFVSKVNVNIGKFVNPTDVLFELINPDDMHASLTVFEKDMPSVKVGQKVKVSFVNDPEKTFDCEVILVTRNVDENRSGTVHCHFETRPKSLLPGMFLNAAIELRSSDVVSVPEQALVRFANREYLFEEVSPLHYRMVEVKTGMREGGFAEISGIEDMPGRKWVLKNAYAVLGKLKNTSEE